MRDRVTLDRMQRELVALAQPSHEVSASWFPDTASCRGYVHQLAYSAKEADRIAGDFKRYYGRNKEFNVRISILE